MKASPLYTFLFLLLLTASAFAGESVRVLVMDDLESVVLALPPEYGVRNEAGEGVVTKEEDGGTRISLDSRKKADAGVRINAGSSIIDINDFSLTGIISIKRNTKGLYCILNELGLEDYTRAVVGEEMGSKWPIEALKAQAVIARTYVLFKKRNAATAEYDLCSTVNSQVFMGDGKEKDGPARAVRETEGEVLTYEGALVETPYHASCGGDTERSADVWGRDYPYLKSCECVCEGDSPFRKWEKRIDAGDVSRALRTINVYVGEVKKVSIAERTASGRVKLVKITGEGGAKTMKGADFRRAVGYSTLPSTAFEVRRENGSFVFTGRGSGHGVGLCQWGAKKMAEDGANYLEILTHYYPGAIVTKAGVRD